ncbi:MAG: carboxymuconolactone decarboxylase family protein [Phycisphaerae bacterium]|jgi:alkylhydroperoxidase/carboxymuconolactone decarboxylase family protein YurZ
MSEPPDYYKRFKEKCPELMQAFETLGETAKNAGPLDARTSSLVKLALSLAAGLEGGSHSAVKKALAAGCSPEEIRHVPLLAVTTLGFPTMMRARSWVEDVLEESK